MNIILKQKKEINFIILISAIFLFSLNTMTYSQESEIKIETEIENASGKKVEDGSILVKCFSFSSDYLYLLYDEEPMGNAEIIQQSERTSETQYKFNSLKPGLYFVCVYDQDNNSACYKVEIGRK